MKVGDYVRTDIGEIRKVVKVTDDLYVLDKDILFAHKDKIKKSSPNIIDLIEVGDYVNGFKVDKVEERYILFGNDNLTLAYKFNYDKYMLRTEDIKSIVTKEQFESMEYKVKE